MEQYFEPDTVLNFKNINFILIQPFVVGTVIIIPLL